MRLNQSHHIISTKNIKSQPKQISEQIINSNQIIMITKLATCYVHTCNDHARAYYILGQQGSSLWFSLIDYRCAQALSSAVS